MTTEQIANRLVEICRTGDWEKAQNELFSEDAVSIEQTASPMFEKETHGLPALKEKAAKWNSMVEQVHRITVSEPLIGINSFAITIRMEITMKERGAMDITEVCVYTIKDGKINSEQFFM